LVNYFQAIVSSFTVWFRLHSGILTIFVTIFLTGQFINMNLIVIEGLDGAGKSTQIKLLQEYFEKSNIPSRYLHFPRTDSPYFGELISRFLKGDFGRLEDVNPYLVAMIYAGDRKDASVEIRRWLSSGMTVILDRYVYSNIAYQCAKIDNKDERVRLKKWIFDLEFNHFGIPRPDLNIFLDVTFEFTASKLMNDRKGTDRNYLDGNSDIHENSLKFQRSVRDVYLDASKSDETLQIVNCSDTEGRMLAPEGISVKIIQLLVRKGLAR